MRLYLALAGGLGLLGLSARGEVYGTVRMGKELLAGVPVTVTCSAVPVSATTDKYGAYRLFAKASGKCTLAVKYHDKEYTLPITSSSEGVRYRLVLEEANGKVTLRSE